MRNAEIPKADLVYTLIINKAYNIITSMFEDAYHRDLEQDTMTVVKGLQGSYPNFFLGIDSSQVHDFFQRCATIEHRVWRPSGSIAVAANDFSAVADEILGDHAAAAVLR